MASITDIVSQGHEAIQAEFRRLINRRIESCIEPDFEKIEVLTANGYLPSDDILQEASENYVNHRMFTKLNRLRKITGYTPVFSSDFVHSAYAGYIRGGSYSDMDNLRSLSGIVPDEELVQKSYVELWNWFEKNMDYTPISNLRLLRSASGIEPSPEMDKRILSFMYLKK